MKPEWINSYEENTYKTNFEDNGNEEIGQDWEKGDTKYVCVSSALSCSVDLK